MPDELTPALTPGELKQTLVNYYLTPKEFRDTDATSLDGLAKDMGLPTNSFGQMLTKNPQIGHQLLMLTASMGTVHIPDVLEVLVKAAKGGNVRAAEVFLTHLRATILDDKLISANEKATQSLRSLLEGDAHEAAAAMLKDLQALGDDPAAHGLPARTEDAVIARTTVAIKEEIKVPLHRTEQPVEAIDDAVVLDEAKNTHGIAAPGYHAK